MHTHARETRLYIFDIDMCRQLQQFRYSTFSLILHFSPVVSHLADGDRGLVTALRCQYLRRNASPYRNFPLDMMYQASARQSCPPSPCGRTPSSTPSPHPNMSNETLPRPQLPCLHVPLSIHQEAAYSPRHAPNMASSTRPSRSSQNPSTPRR
jgi:hypothetical protein